MQHPIKTVLAGALVAKEISDDGSDKTELRLHGFLSASDDLDERGWRDETSTVLYICLDRNGNHGTTWIFMGNTFRETFWTVLEETRGIDGGAADEALVKLFAKVGYVVDMKFVEKFRQRQKDELEASVGREAREVLGLEAAAK